MSQQHFPTGPADQPGAGHSAPPSGWAPAPLSDGGRPSVAREPQVAPPRSTPIGGQLSSVKIDEFAPPRSRLPLVVVVVALLVAGLIWAGTAWRGQQDITAGSSPSPSASSPGATSTASGLPFVTPDQRYNGRWEVLRHQWTDSGLEVEIRLAADKGPISYSFLAFGNNDVQATNASPGSQNPKFDGLPLQTGQEATGWLFFPLERGASTIILATASGNQMSALAVAG
ncbi:MAG: hypothetical protein LCH96_13810 [Actinobacteria bacterium]|nr:hypothetical protein [Actinomycetota bacterium]